MAPPTPACESDGVGDKLRREGGLAGTGVRGRGVGVDKHRSSPRFTPPHTPASPPPRVSSDATRAGKRSLTARPVAPGSWNPPPASPTAMVWMLGRAGLPLAELPAERTWPGASHARRHNG